VNASPFSSTPARAPARPIPGARTAIVDEGYRQQEGPVGVSKPHTYSQHTAALRAELGEAVPRPLLRALHERSAARHLLVAARQFAILGACTWGLVRFPQPLIWVPLALVQGFTIFDFTVLLHEVVHGAVFARRRAAAERWLGFLYAVPSGISATQFTRWHLDHHAELGSTEHDPKRHHLSPTINVRWYKLLYATPALFFIYFRAARRESATYPPEVRARIAVERRVSTAAHLAALGLLAWLAGPWPAVRAYVLPVFFVFPVAFTLNRLGQHYDIDPSDPARWTTLVRGHWFWDFVFINSNYHIEHHYFPGVPFYRLPALQRALAPFYERHRIPWRSYGELIRGWLVDNQAPHTNWADAPADERR
jgi:fatty acid desaturase